PRQCTGLFLFCALRNVSSCDGPVACGNHSSTLLSRDVLKARRQAMPGQGPGRKGYGSSSKRRGHVICILIPSIALLFAPDLDQLNTSAASLCQWQRRKPRVVS